MNTRPPFWIRIRPFRAIVLLSLVLLLAAESFAQQRSGSAAGRAPATGTKAAPKTKAAPPSDNPAYDLPQYIERHAAALKTGTPSAIESSSQKLAALGLRLIGDLRFRQSALPDSIQAYRQSLEFEDVPETHLDLALTLVAAGQLEDAMAEVKPILEKNPRSARAWRVQSKILQSKRDYLGEAEALAHSLEISANVNVEYALGLAFLNAKKKEKADAVFKEIVAVNGNKPIYHVMFGDAYRDAEFFPEAIRQFKQAIAMDPNVDHAYFFLGYTYLLQNHYAPNEDSVREFREDVRRHPDEFFGNFYLGVMESSFKQFEQSNVHLRAAVKADPQSMEGWLYLGLNCYQLTDYPNAKTYFLKAIELVGSDEARNNYQIRRAYTSLGRILALEGKREEASEYVRRAKEMEFKALQNAQKYVASQATEEGMGPAPGVLAELPKPQPEGAGSQKAAATDESSSLTPEEKRQVQDREKALRTLVASSLNDWGTTEARRELFGQALIHFHQAENWDPAVPGLMRNIGMAAMRVEGYPEAVRTLSVAVEQNPRDKLARAMLAVALFSMNRYEEAAKQFNQVGEDVQSDPRMAYAWAFSLSRSNQPKESSAVLDKLTAKPLPPDLYLLSGQVYGALGDFEHAIGCYKKALAVDPSLPRAHYNAGLALIRLDRPTDAIPEFQAELKISPDDTETKYHLAFALLQSSHTAEAVALLRSVIEAHPEHAQAQYQLGKELLAEGVVDEAIQHLAAAAQLDPDKDYIRYQLQTAYRRAGRKEEADRELKVYQDIKNAARGRPTSAH